MRERIFINPLQNRDRVNWKKNRSQKHYERLSVICFGGGLLGILLGSIMLFIFNATDKISAALQYRGVAVILIAALMLGGGAHFMDKSDDEKRRAKKLKIACLTEHVFGENALAETRSNFLRTEKQIGSEGRVSRNIRSNY